MKFKILAVSSSANSFGLAGHILVARSGQAYEVGRSIACPTPWKRGQVVVVPQDDNGRLKWEAVGCEIPRELPKAPPRVVAEVWA